MQVRPKVRHDLRRGHVGRVVRRSVVRQQLPDVLGVRAVVVDRARRDLHGRIRLG